MTSSESRGWLTPDLAQIVTRFPVPLAISVAFAIIANLEIANVIDLPSFRWDRPDLAAISRDQVYGALATGFFASGAAHLFAEGRRWGRLAGALLALALALIVGLICWNMRLLDLQHLFFIPALILTVAVAGYLRNGASETALWMFNARLALAVLTAIVVGVIFGAGLSAIVESLHYLFGTNIHSAHEYIWMTAATLISPVAGLSMVSSDLDEEFRVDGDKSLLVNGVSRILNYLLIPIALVYIVILHLYAAKMLLEWELPKGQVGIMVAVFSIGGAAIWLIALPWRSDGSALVRLFEKSFLWFLVVPLILLGIGTWRRIADYGVTPDRYGLVALGLWLVILVVWFGIVKRGTTIRVTLGSLAIVLAVSSFGPWGARSVSAQSQFERLVALMRENGYFQSGVLEIPEGIDAKTSREGASIVGYLVNNGHIRKLKPLLAGNPVSPPDLDGPFATSDEVAGLFLFSQHLQDQQTYSVSFTANGPFVTELASDTVFSGPHRIDEAPPAAGGNKPDPVIILNGDLMTISYRESAWNIATQSIVEKAREAERKEDMSPLVLTVEGQNGLLRLMFLQVWARVKDGKTENFNGSVNMFLPADGS